MHFVCRTLHLTSILLVPLKPFGLTIDGLLARSGPFFFIMTGTYFFSSFQTTQLLSFVVLVATTVLLAKHLFSLFRKVNKNLF